MFSFFHGQPTKWLMERERPGRYHNSPARWTEVGLVYAASRTEALKKANEAIGFGNVRVRPLEDAR